MIQASEDKQLQVLKNVIGFKMEPPTIDEFLDSDYYLGALDLMVYPFWRKRLRELFPNNITSTSTYVCLYGCIGGGKSFFSQLVLLYDVVKVACCEDFFKFNDLTLTKGIYIKCSNTWKNKSQEAVDFLNDVVFGGKVPFFENELRKGNKFLKNLKFKAVGTRESDLRSDDVLCFWLSELTAMKTAVGQNLISSSDSRLTSRFISSERLFTHIILDSSTTGVDSALDLFLRNDPKAEKAFKVHVNSWNTTEGLGRYFNFGSFEVYAGDSQRNPFIIPKNFSEHERSQLDKDRIIICPNELIEEAKRNIVLFLQEKAGISTNTSSKFFLDRQKVEQAFCLSKSYDDSLALRFFDPLDTLMSKLKDTVSTLPQDRKLYIRIDCGVANDLFGICVAYGDGVKRVNVDGIPTERLRIKIPIALGISRYEGEETSISKVEDFILQLNQDYEVALVLTDQYQCFTGETKISLLSGEEVEISEIVRRFEAGEEMYTYTLDVENQRLVSGKILKAWKTGEKRIMKVTLDNGEVIRCTLNHRFMLRDGSYCEAQNLKPGTSLMPLYRNIDDCGYEVYQNPFTMNWDRTYRSIAAFNYDYHTGLQVHHLDFSKSNNNPSNLAVLTKEEHFKAHNSHIKELVDSDPKYWSNWMKKNYENHPELKEKSSIRFKETIKKNWENPEIRQRMIENNAFKRPEVRELSRIATIESFNKDGGKRRQEQAERITKINKELKPRLGSDTSEEARKRFSEANKKTWESEEYRKKMSKRYPGSSNYLKHKYGKDWKSKLTPEQIEEEKRLCREEWEKTHCETYNHKVVSIEITDDVEPVYDLCIDSFPNFALSSGVFVHNSTSLRQTMKQNGIKAELESVDRDDNAYVITKNYIYQDLIEIADNRIALKEMLELERVGPRKVDHPAKELGGCFTGDTEVLIVSDNSEIKKVKFSKLCNLTNPKVLTYDLDSKEFVVENVKSCGITKYTKELIQLEFDSGVITCTPDHRFLTKNRGWVEAKDLTEKDDVTEYGL